MGGGPNGEKKYEAPAEPGGAAPSPSRPSDLPKGNHYASRDRKKMAAEYAYLWPLATINVGKAREAADTAAWILRGKEAFEGVSSQTGVPWWVIGILNVMESGQDFNGTLLNGDAWNQVTKHYPSGLGPWSSWRQAAVFALQHEAKGWGFILQTYPWHKLEEIFYFLECYNGHNARLAEGAAIDPPNASPYIYSATQFYRSGKRTEVLGSDGKYHGAFDKNLVSSQVGCMALAKALEGAGVKLA